MSGPFAGLLVFKVACSHVVCCAVVLVLALRCVASKPNLFNWVCCADVCDELAVCRGLGWCSGIVLSKLRLCAAVLSVTVVHSGVYMSWADQDWQSVFSIS